MHAFKIEKKTLQRVWQAHWPTNTHAHYAKKKTKQNGWEEVLDALK